MMRAAEKSDDGFRGLRSLGISAVVAVLFSVGSAAPVIAEPVIEPLGGVINGEAEEDRSGTAVAMSGDGTRVAIGAPLNGRFNDGNVRVFEYVSNTWEQVGASLTGAASSDQFGTSVALNGDGSRLAVGGPFFGDGDLFSNKGHVKVYELSSGSWNPIGEIKGTGSSDQFGTSVSLSSDGNTIAVGAPQFVPSTGYAQVWDYVEGSWEQRGSDFTGVFPADRYGYAVSLSSDGGRVAIGAPYHGDGLRTGLVEVWEYSGTAWAQLGEDLGGTPLSNDEFGYSVALSPDGNFLAAGAIKDDDGGTDAGYTKIFSFDTDSASWGPLGTAILGGTGEPQSGYSVSLASGGSRVAIGAPFNDDAADTAGQVRVFDYSADEELWSQVATDIDGEEGDRLGSAVSLSSDGARLAVGAPRNDSSFSDAGQVQVFSIAEPEQDPVAGTSSGTGRGTDDVSIPGTFLTVDATVGARIGSSSVAYGSYAIRSGSPYSLTLRNESSETVRVMATGRVNRGGHLDATVSLGTVAAGTYTVILTAQSAQGSTLVLGNRFRVDDRGLITFVTAEADQPRIR